MSSYGEDEGQESISSHPTPAKTRKGSDGGMKRKLFSEGFGPQEL